MVKRSPTLFGPGRVRSPPMSLYRETIKLLGLIINTACPTSTTASIMADTQHEASWKRF
jgi:hypothetical protein